MTEPAWLKCSDTISAPCPMSVCSAAPLSASHSLAVLSMLPVAMVVPVGSKLMHTISVLWPL